MTTSSIVLLLLLIITVFFCLVFLKVIVMFARALDKLDEARQKGFIELMGGAESTISVWGMKIPVKFQMKIKK